MFINQVVLQIVRRKYEWVFSKRQISDECIYDLNPHNDKMWLCENNGNPKTEPYISSIMKTELLRFMYVGILIVNIVLLFIAVANSL